MLQLHVAVGVLFNEHHEVLIGQRTRRDRYFGKWEFPGGKLEPGETSVEALKRELWEELGVEVLDQSPLIQISHDYPEYSVELDVFVIRGYRGQAQGQENQALQWIKTSELNKIDFLSGNREIIEAVQSLR